MAFALHTYSSMINTAAIVLQLEQPNFYLMTHSLQLYDSLHCSIPPRIIKCEQSRIADGSYANFNKQVLKYLFGTFAASRSNR